MAPSYSPDPTMQRLFTTFPNGWPGAGLLLLRLICASPLLVDGLGALSPGTASIAPWLRPLGLIPGILVLLGSFTPVAALLQTLIEVALALAVPPLAVLHLTRAGIGVALMGLGPGAWSLDARFYGRKRLEL
jgi:putative oxidoreductase